MDNLCSVDHGDDVVPKVSLVHNQIRKRFFSDFVQRFPNISADIIYIVGGETQHREDSDTEILFRQDSSFWYLTGVEKPDFQAVIELGLQKITLLAPKLPSNYAVWNGKIETLDEIKEYYGVDNVIYKDDLKRLVGELSERIGPNIEFHVMPGAPVPAALQNFKINSKVLRSSIFDARVVKTDLEVQLMRVSNAISSFAHRQVMHTTKVGMFEYEIESQFLFSTYDCSLRFQAYIPIVAGGNRSAFLHYELNNQQLNDLASFVLIDAGGELSGYASDITRTWPLSGKFTADQRVLYQMVYNVQTALLSKIQKGSSWTSYTSLTQTLICEELINNGFVTSSPSLCVSRGIPSLFMPHGLGHLIGLDVHDVSSTPRTLTPNMALTIEPGIYFNSVLLNEMSEKKKEILNLPKVASFAYLGGVRIEDTILITETGYEDLSGNAPKSIEEIEATMAKL